MTDHPIDPAIRSEIERHLAAIEADHGVRILFACESGSRGWGFASPDSDYDVRFLYVLRPLLAARWIEQGRGVAPMRFADLVDALVTEPALRDAIADLLARKRRALESEHGAPLRVIDDYIAAELARLEDASVPMPRDIDFSVLDRLLLDTVTRSEGDD